MAQSKYDRFWAANKAVETWTRSGERGTLTLTEEIDAVFGKWGAFHVDNAETVLLVSRMEDVAPELLAITWMNESSFSFLVEPNKNNQPDNFNKWDVGPMQVNVEYTLADIEVGFFSGAGLDVKAALGTPVGSTLFNGDILENMRLGARKLKALGRAGVVGKNKVILLPKVTVEAWKTTDEDIKNLRRAALYTRPDARDARIGSYLKFATMFKTFFASYGEQ